MCQSMQKTELDRVLHTIEQADDFQIQDIMRAVERRYAIAFPDWEVVYMAVHKDPQMRRKDLEGILAMIEKEKMDSLG